VTRTTDIVSQIGGKDIDDAQGASGSYSTNPTNLVYFYITLAPMNASTAVTARVNVEIRYWVKFYGLNDVPDS